MVADLRKQLALIMLDRSKRRKQHYSVLVIVLSGIEIHTHAQRLHVAFVDAEHGFQCCAKLLRFTGRLLELSRDSQLFAIESITVNVGHPDTSSERDMRIV